MEQGNTNLKINPSILHFPPPFDNRVITNILKLQNVSTEKFIAFKVKTTRPHRYSVKPHIGLIKPGEKVEVLVRFNHQKDPIKDTKERDKFQVETINLDTAPPDVANLFKTTPQDQIIKEKLKCRFAAITSPKTVTTTDSSGNTSILTADGGELSGVAAIAAEEGSEGSKGSDGGFSDSAMGGGKLDKESSSAKPSYKESAKKEEDPTRQIQELKNKVAELTKKNTDIENARNKMAAAAKDAREKASASKIMGLSRSVLIVVALVALLSFFLGAIIF